MAKKYELSADVRLARHSRFMSQSELASELDIPLRTLQGIEAGRSFRYGKMLRLALVALANRR
jgi:DNA-binding XRE family transcriptional regulator